MGSVPSFCDVNVECLHAIVIERANILDRSLSIQHVCVRGRADSGAISIRRVVVFKMISQMERR